MVLKKARCLFVGLHEDYLDATIKTQLRKWTPPKKMPRNPSLLSIDIWINSHKVLEFTNFNWPLGHLKFTFTWSMNDSFKEEPIQIRKAHGHSKCVEISNGCIKLHVCIYCYVCKINENISTCKHCANLCDST